ncbi:DUF167 domain-containing protein [Sphingomonas sp. 2R-10]|uniref:DUF167 domain-containing protein n=1 Tax=Sphingomonas sp. 2R-10 TaxID=3045148 RepID=UPI000F792674|nr:DUF167 domain-containing protein [Sphingomonas sp. 2R-10]MDJ0278442.1 DUF167 domain-containing protein [Sphingomonas sp. 2R-10]
MPPPFTLDADGVTLTIRVTPKASRTAMTGVATLENGATALGLRIAAPPVEGAANDEVVRFVARQLRVGRRAVTLVSGGTARVKRVRIGGDPVALAAALHEWIDP